MIDILMGARWAALVIGFPGCFAASIILAPPTIYPPNQSHDPRVSPARRSRISLLPYED